MAEPSGNCGNVLAARIQLLSSSPITKALKLLIDFRSRRSDFGFCWGMTERESDVEVVLGVKNDDRRENSSVEVDVSSPLLG